MRETHASAIAVRGFIALNRVVDADPGIRDWVISVLSAHARVCPYCGEDNFAHSADCALDMGADKG